MSAILLQEQKTLTKPNIYSEDMSTGMLITKELLNNKMFGPLSNYLLYFKCTEGHITQCSTPTHQLFFCKQCNALIPKKDCDKFTDRTSQIEQRRTSKKIKHGSKVLYQFPESARRYYPRHKKKENTE